MAQDDWEVASSAEARLRPESLIAPYLDHVRRLFPSVGRLAGTRLAVDMANGATTTTAVTLLESLGFELVRRGDHPDGRNINLECGSTHPASLAAAVLEHGCQLGVAFDGDGDRAIFVDGRGHIVDGDAVLLVLAISALGAGRLIGNTVVATVMSNVGLEMALRKHGIRLIRTPVGDKHVIEEMLRGGYVLGGEQSGHVIQAEHLPTGDGLATALGVLRVMEATGRSLAELAADLVTYPQTLLNVRVREKAPIETVPAVSAAIGRVEHALANRGRLLVRYSGTEPLLRIMIEGEDQASIQMWAEEIAEAARSHLN
jgi:phosphoglucosamine mutase